MPDLDPDTVYELSQRTARRLAQALREVEGLKRHTASGGSTRGVIPQMQILKAKANGAIPKGGSGKADIWSLQDYSTPHSVSNSVTTLSFEPVFAWGIPDGMQWPDGAELWLIYCYGETSGWHVLTGYPCPEAITSGS